MPPFGDVLNRPKFGMRWVSRRSSSSFSPTNTALMDFWYDASDITTLWKNTARSTPVSADGDIVLGVTDKSGNGKHLSEATNGPTYKVALQNGLSELQFDGVNDKLASTPTASGGCTYFLATKKRTAPAGSSQAVMGWDTNAQLFTNSGVSTGYNFFANQAAGSTLLGGTPASYNILVLRVSSAASADGWVNGGAGTNFDPNDVLTTSTTLTLGTQGANLGNYDIGELIRYNTTLGLANLNIAAAALASKWGTVWTTAT